MLVSGVWGGVESGQLMAVVGPSGSGATLLYLFLVEVLHVRHAERTSVS